MCVYMFGLNHVASIEGHIMTLLSLLGTSLYCIIAFGNPLSDKGILCILPLGIVICSDFITFSISILTNYLHPFLAWQPSAIRFFMMMIHTFITIILYQIMIKILLAFRHLRYFSQAMRVYFISLVVLGIIASNILFRISTEAHLLSNNTLTLDLYVIYIGSIFLLMMGIIIFVLRKWGILIQKLKQSELEKMRSEYYENIEAAAEKLDHFRHDFTKHMDVLQILLDDRNYSQASDYLKSLTVRCEQNIGITKFTNNDILNAILARKQTLCQKHGISFRVMSEPLEAYPLSATELCCVFDNLLTNAWKPVRELMQRLNDL